MLLIYIMAQSNNGRLNATYKLPNNKSNPNSNVGVLSWSTAPRTIQDISSNGAIRGPSYQEYENPVNPNSTSSTLYNSDELDPLPDNFIPTQNSYVNTGGIFADRPENAPYYLFFGKFASQGVSNLQPKFVGHKDEVNVVIDQQPSNIYNIPDFPKDYTLYKSENTNVTGVGDNQEMPLNLSTAEKLVYDASSCPVNWRMFGPIREKVLDISENGITGGGGGGSGGSGTGTGTDLSFNEFFFKQPGMPMDCSAVFVNANPKRLELSWDIPFNRLSGTTFTNGEPRFFCKNNESENWLPAFNDFVIDISSNITGAPQTFCKDASGNFVPDNGTTKAYAIISPNNTTVVLNDVLTTATGCQPNQNSSTLKYGTTGSTTTITGGIISSDSARNVDGRGLTINSNTPIFQAGNIYDIAMYYHNNTKINTPSGLAITDVKYNNHNVCLLKDVIFGEPGNAQQPDSLLLWGNPLNNGSRYYFGGIGGNAKDVELNLDWTRTSLVKVGYDCSLNVTPNPSPIQVVGINRQNLSYSNYDVSYNLNINEPQPYPPLNMNAGVSGSNIPGTKKNWPSGGGTGGSIAVSSSATADSDFDYIKKIDELTGIPATLARDHPEYKYTAENYSVVNDTKDPNTNTVTYINKTPTYTFEGVIPIFPRSACNTKNDTDYNNMMTEYTETPSNNNNSNFLTIYKEDNNGNLINAGTGISARTRYLVNGTLTSNPPGVHGTYDDIIAFGDKSNPTYYKLKLKSDTRVFKQLANYGDVLTGIRPSQTVNDLVPADSMIGKLGLSGASPGLLHEVKLKPEAQNSGSGGTFVSIRNGTPNSQIMKLRFLIH